MKALALLLLMLALPIGAPEAAMEENVEHIIPRLNRNPAEEASQNREFGFDWGDDSSEFSFS